MLSTIFGVIELLGRYQEQHFLKKVIPCPSNTSVFHAALKICTSHDDIHLKKDSKQFFIY